MIKLLDGITDLLVGGCVPILISCTITVRVDCIYKLIIHLSTGALMVLASMMQPIYFKLHFKLYRNGIVINNFLY